MKRNEPQMDADGREDARLQDARRKRRERGKSEFRVASSEWEVAERWLFRAVGDKWAGRGCHALPLGWGRAEVVRPCLRVVGVPRLSGPPCLWFAGKLPPVVVQGRICAIGGGFGGVGAEDFFVIR